MSPELRATLFSILIIVILLLSVRVVSRSPVPVSSPQQEVDRTYKGDKAGDENGP